MWMKSNTWGPYFRLPADDFMALPTLFPNNDPWFLNLVDYVNHPQGLRYL